jgi:hypothetical protein
MDPPSFISSPRGRDRCGYGGFVYVEFAIGGFLECPSKVATWHPTS